VDYARRMPKERTVNPAQAQRKAEKAKAIKKGIFLLYPALKVTS
jgi:hypothetical protein